MTIFFVQIKRNFRDIYEIHFFKYPFIIKLATFNKRSTVELKLLIKQKYIITTSKMYARVKVYKP